MNKKIVLVTPGQPSSNPRLMKEAISLSDSGYKVTVVYNYWSDWADEQDQELIQIYPNITFIKVGGDPRHDKWMYAFTRIRHKIFRLLNQVFSSILYFASRAECRAYEELKTACLEIKADLYIAHHVGLLPVAYLAAQQHKAKWGFDAEDFHRGLNEFDLASVQRSILLENTFIERCDYLSASSPLIAAAYEQLYGKEVQVINNVFSKKYQQSHASQTVSLPIGLFWFSQTIGKGRGIEDILQAMAGFENGSFKLTLLGQHDKKIKAYFEDYLSQYGGNKADLIFKDPVSLNKIFQISAEHDVGLALEITAKTNNQLCLANKIFTYLLAGNAIIFSNTNAHQLFWKQHKEIGYLYTSGNISELKQILADIMENPMQLIASKKSSLDLAMIKYNWEMESALFLEKIRTVLQIA